MQPILEHNRAVVVLLLNGRAHRRRPATTSGRLAAPGRVPVVGRQDAVAQRVAGARPPARLVQRQAQRELGGPHSEPVGARERGQVLEVDRVACRRRLDERQLDHVGRLACQAGQRAERRAVLLALAGLGLARLLLEDAREHALGRVAPLRARRLAPGTARACGRHQRPQQTVAPVARGARVGPGPGPR